MPHAMSHKTPIYYEVHGQGEPTLVFAHGMGGNAAIWYQQVAEFSARHRIVTFDHRYFGRSACPAEDFDPRLFPADALAVMQAAKVEEAVFICQSMGGWTGSQLALQHPERVLGLVLSHTPGVFVSEYAPSDPAAVARFVSTPRSEFGNAALAPDFPEKNPVAAFLYGQLSSFNQIDPSLIPRKIAAAQLSQDTAQLSDYRTPTLFVSADHDPLFPPGFLNALAATLPGARFKNLGDAGHSSYFERPEAFNQTLAEFLASLK